MNLIAGPYDHEFGHELFSFQGRVRYLSNDYDKVAVCTKPQMQFLYEDFAHEFIPFTDSLDRNLYTNTNFVDKASFKLKRAAINIKEKQKFIKYGKKVDEFYDIIFLNQSLNIFHLQNT